MLTPVHVRMARAALKWSFIDLEKRTGVSKNTLVRFEAGGGIQHSTAIKIEETLVREGILFSDERDPRGFGVFLSPVLVRRIGETTLAAGKGVSGRAARKSKPTKSGRKS